MSRNTTFTCLLFLLVLSTLNPVYAGGRKGTMSSPCIDFKQLAGAGGNPSDPAQVQARALGNRRQTQETAFREFNRVANEYFNLLSSTLRNLNGTVDPITGVPMSTGSSSGGGGQN